MKELIEKRLQKLQDNHQKLSYYKESFKRKEITLEEFEKLCREIYIDESEDDFGNLI